MAEFQNIPLFPGEQVVFAADFTPSPILRANKSGLVVTKQRVAVVHPQHVFVFFKVGDAVHSSPIAAIAEVTVGRLVSQRRLRLAIFAGLFGTFLLFSAAGGLSGGGAFGSIGILFAFACYGAAAFQLWLARHLGLSVRNFAGGTLSVAADSTEYQAMMQAANAIQQLILNTTRGSV